MAENKNKLEQDLVKTDSAQQAGRLLEINEILFKAIEKSDLQALENIFDQHKELVLEESLTEDGFTPLKHAIRVGQLEAVKYLLAQDCSYSEDLLALAQSFEQTKIYDFLSKIATQLLFQIEKCKIGAEELIKNLNELFAQGYSPNLKLSNGNSLLHCALNNPHLDPKIIRFLIEKGADLSYVDSQGVSPLHRFLTNGLAKNNLGLLLEYYKSFETNIMANINRLLKMGPEIRPKAAFAIERENKKLLLARHFLSLALNTAYQKPKNITDFSTLCDIDYCYRLVFDAHYPKMSEQSLVNSVYKKQEYECYLNNKSQIARLILSGNVVPLGQYPGLEQPVHSTLKLATLKLDSPNDLDKNLTNKTQRMSLALSFAIQGLNFEVATQAFLELVAEQTDLVKVQTMCKWVSEKYESIEAWLINMAQILMNELEDEAPEPANKSQETGKGSPLESHGKTRQENQKESHQQRTLRFKMALMLAVQSFNFKDIPLLFIEMVMNWQTVFESQLMVKSLASVYLQKELGQKTDLNRLPNIEKLKLRAEILKTMVEIDSLDKCIVKIAQVLKLYLESDAEDLNFKMVEPQGVDCIPRPLWRSLNYVSFMDPRLKKMAGLEASKSVLPKLVPIKNPLEDKALIDIKEGFKLSQELSQALNQPSNQPLEHSSTDTTSTFYEQWIKKIKASQEHLSSVEKLKAVDKLLLTNEDPFPKLFLFNINIIDFQQAILQNKIKIIELLLKFRPQFLSHIHVPGQTPFMISAAVSDIDTVKCLMTHDPDLWKPQTPHGHNAFIYAVKYGSLAVMEYLIKAGFEPAFYQAKTKGYLNPEKNGRSALWFAVSQGNFPKIKCLLTHFPGMLNVQDDLGRTPLHRAAEGGHLEIVKFLVNAGAKLGVLSNRNNDERAVRRKKKLDEDNSKQMSEYLDNAHCLLKMIVEQSDMNNIPKIKSLLQHFSTKLSDSAGNTLLHLAFKHSNVLNFKASELIFHLLDLGADFFAVNDKKQTPIQVCSDSVLQFHAALYFAHQLNLNPIKDHEKIKLLKDTLNSMVRDIVSCSLEKRFYFSKPCDHFPPCCIKEYNNTLHNKSFLSMLLYSGSVVCLRMEASALEFTFPCIDSIVKPPLTFINTIKPVKPLDDDLEGDLENEEDPIIVIEDIDTRLNGSSAKV